MTGLLRISALIDGFNTAIGRFVSWLILVAVVVSAGNAIIRKIFNQSSNAWLELQWYLFGAVFLLGAAWTLLRREHIRIDIVSNLLPRWLRHTIELLGHIFFLMPLAALIVYLAWPFFATSVIGVQKLGQTVGFANQAAVVWASIVGGIGEYLDRLPAMVRNLLDHGAFDSGRGDQAAKPFGWEYSTSAGGLATWPAKFMVLAGFALLFLQGISEILKHLNVMLGNLPEPETGSSHGGASHES